MTSNKESIREKTKGKIVLIKGQSQYNVLCRACDQMAKGFEENGYRTVIIDGTKIYGTLDFYLKIKQEMEDDGLFIFSFNAIYHNSMVNEQMTVYDYMGYPVFGFLVDHPYYQAIRVMATKSDKIHIGCIDPDHVTYISQYFPNIKHAAFLPHFSFKSDIQIPYEDRTIDIYYPGSYQSPESYVDKFNGLPDVFLNLAKWAAEVLLQDNSLTFDEALRRYFAGLNFDYSTDEFLELMDQLHFVDHYVRDYRRDKIARTILEAGIPLTVSGNGWEQLKDQYQDKITILGEGGLDIEENIKVIANTKILFNTFPNFKNGTHERIFTAMMNGCVCLTDRSGYLLQNFIQDEELVYYDMNMIDLIPGIINELLGNQTKSAQIAYNGYQRVYNQYDDKSIARNVLTLMGLE